MQKLGLARKTFPSDLVAGTVNAVTSIPDALGSAVLAGLDPIHGLYAIMVGTPVGALTTGAVFMNVSITGAMALAVGDSLAGYSGEERVAALIVLTVLVGVTALILAGRGRDEAIDTFLTWLQRYAAELRRSGNLLMLAEVRPKVREQLKRTGVIEDLGAENVFEAQSILGASIEEARAVADEWLAERRAESEG